MLFGMIASAPPQGRHKRAGKQQILVAGAVQKHRKPNPIPEAFKKLSTRERVMVASLLVVAVVAVAVFVFILPSLEKISTLKGEIVTLQSEKNAVQSTLDHIPAYQTTADTFEQDYQNYQHFYYPFMDPETIDKTVTTMLIENEMVPQRLSMTAITSELVPAYVPFTLVPKPLPTAFNPTEDDTASDPASKTAGGDYETAGDSEAADAGIKATGVGDETTEPPAEDTGLQEGKLVYCYTVDVEAQGWMRNLFTFLAQAKSITAMEVTRYSYIEPEDPKQSLDEDGDLITEWPEGGTVIMQLKLYVFVDGGVTKPAES